MKSTFPKILAYLKRKTWMVIVAYMVGIHIFYKEEKKTPDNIILTIEHDEVDEDSAPRN